MDILEHNDYRVFLRQVLAEKAQINPRFSLRAFAQKIGLAPSFLSDVLKGKKALSPEKAILVAERLNLKGKSREYFCTLAQIEATQNPELKESFLNRAQSLSPKSDVHNLNLDHFRIIADWYHFAIMAMTDLPSFQTTPEEFAKALGISNNEAELALGRLERLEMIEYNSQGRICKTKSNPRVISISANTALRSFHRQTLQKAMESLEAQTPQEKIVGSETFAFDRSQMDQVRELTDRYFEDILRIAKKTKKKDSVYHLGVQFFNMTKNIREKS